MMRIAFLPLLFCIFLEKGFSQSDSARIDYIYVGRNQKPVESLPQNRFNRDFIRQKYLLRLSLDDPSNRCLVEGNLSQVSAEPGIVPSLLQAFREGKLTGVHPGTLTRGYSYVDLMYDMLRLQGEDPFLLEDEVPTYLVEWVALHFYLDIIGDRGQEQGGGKRFFRPQYLRFLWVLPESPRGLYAVVMFPYREVAPLLESLQCQGGYSLHEKIVFRQLAGNWIRLDRDETPVLVGKN